ncbi:hypothetical protein KF728_17415 [Candidatus Obscuribacterales bacterium]|nr:hypothetical protein [Candidatus Obscuribacterales bacterium]
MGHAFKSRHFLMMNGYFIAAAAITLLLGVGVSAGSLLTGIMAAAIIGVTGMFFGLGVTIALRAVLGLMQTGRVVQYLCFILGSWLGVGLASLLIGSLSVTSGFGAALATFSLAFGAATLVGEVPWKGRTWLPVRMPKR